MIEGEIKGTYELSKAAVAAAIAALRSGAVASRALTWGRFSLRRFSSPSLFTVSTVSTVSVSPFQQALFFFYLANQQGTTLIQQEKYGSFFVDTVSSFMCSNIQTNQYSGGISRAKRHQLGITGDVISCTKTPDDVKAILRVDMVDKERIKKGIQEISVQLDADDTIDIEEIRRIRTGKRIAESESSSIAFKKTKGPLDLVYKKSKDTSINDACDKEARARTIQYIGRFFYTCGVAFNVAHARAFKLMLEAVGSYGPHLKPPSYHELRVPILQKELEYTKDLLKNQEVQRNRYGCSIMSDGWTDRKGRTLINFLVNCPAGTMFVRSVDASDYAKTGEKLAELLDTFIEEMGEKNVVQLITDNGSNYVAAGKILCLKRPHMFWTPCAAHCIDLMLEDIGKIPKVKKVIQKGVKVVGYIYNHTFALNLMRKTTGNVELVRQGVTRFATHFLCLQRMQELKGKLREMFLCEEWTTSKCAKDAKGQRAATTILTASFWNDVLYTLKCMAPLVDVLRMVDNEKKPAMGYIYACLQ
ncbi:unnamed protein product [Vicia faba]|uniref:DUF659 domain-containing protein n=1 Tax=Vicia faba TaxID=3906 RepID=A0AAV0ZAL7_VICFA|nr:unnamed protein product [Vicia faba]